jgi:hypothetical protein
MSVLDLSLLRAPQNPNATATKGTGPSGPATIDGWPFRIDPSSVQLPMSAKVQKFRTIGGFVVQVYGTTWGDLTVSGQFGAGSNFAPGGWQAQQSFLNRMVQIAGNQAIQRAPTFAGQNFTPSQPFRFTYPLLGWDFLCYLKDYTSPDGPQAVHLENTNINPKWTLTLFIVTDNNTIGPPGINAYLQRLAPGLGYMWDDKAKKGQDPWQGYQQDQYNSPLTNSDLQDYINDPKGTNYDVVASTAKTTTQPDTTPTTLPGPPTGGKPISTALMTQLLEDGFKQFFPKISSTAHDWLMAQFIGISGAEGSVAYTGMHVTNDVLNTGYGPGAPGTFNAPLPNWDSAYYNAHPSDTEYSIGAFGLNIGYDYYNGSPVEVNYNMAAKYFPGVAQITSGPPNGDQVTKLGNLIINNASVQAMTAVQVYKGAGPSFRPWSGDSYIKGQGGYSYMDQVAQTLGIA